MQQTDEATSRPRIVTTVSERRMTRDLRAIEREESRSASLAARYPDQIHEAACAMSAYTWNQR